MNTAPNAHRDFDPVFVVGCPRSGTTLLTVLLDRNDQIAMTPETHFVEHALAARDHGLPRTHEAMVDHFLVQTHMYDMGLDRQDVLSRFRGDDPTYEGLFRRALESFGARAGKAHVGEKSPEHIFYVPRLLRWFPRAKVIWLVRDGRDAVQAIMRNARFHNDRRRASHLWRSTVAAGRAWEARYPGQILRVRLMDLLREPRRELIRMCDFIGVEFQEQQLDPSTRSGVVLDKEQDYKGRATQSLDLSKIGEYAAQTNEREKWLMDSVMARDLARLGYPPTEARRPPLGVRLWDAALNAPLSLLYQHRFHRPRWLMGHYYRKLAGLLHRPAPPAGPQPGKSSSRVESPAPAWK